ncbi:MFS transporter [Staphylococcus chromogenes]|nr:MFS transporter [Staphylococcus chromogenes]
MSPDRDPHNTWVPIALGMFIIAFGANAFAPMLLVYRTHSGLSEQTVTFLLGTYVLGLIPALLIAGPLSDHLGRRRFMRIAFLASLAASFLFSIAPLVDALLHITVLALARFTCGIAVGCVMASGAAWLREASSAPATIAARRATVATSAGFGLGPLLSGLIAQFLPAPLLLPWLMHLAGVLAIGALAWNAPETIRAVNTRVRRRGLPPAAFTARFLWSVAAWAPWAFGCATTSFATLATLSAHSITHKVAYTGAVAALTMLSGVAIQPLTTRLGSGFVPPAVVGLAMAFMGMVLGWIIAITGSPAWMIPGAIDLGCSYGIMMVSGLREVETIAPSADLGALIGVFYALTYVGFFAPFVLSLVGPVFGFPRVFLFGALVIAISVFPVTHVIRKHQP